MRYLLSIVSLFISLAVGAQTSNVDQINIRKSMRIGGTTISSISPDSSFNNSSDSSVPTARAVRDFVLNKQAAAAAKPLQASHVTLWNYTISFEVPNVPNVESKYLIVSGSAGDTTFTVTGGNGTAELIGTFVAVAYDKTGDHYNSFMVTGQSGSVYRTDRPLPYNLSNDTVKTLWNDWNGQHMTGYGYYGLADYLFEYQKTLSIRDKKLYSFNPEDNPTSTGFVAVGGAVHGGLIPSTSIPQVLGITATTINNAAISINHLTIQQGNASDKGAEWEVSLGLKNGFLETFVGVDHNSRPGGYAKVMFYLDGVLKDTRIVYGAVQKITFPYSNAAKGKLRIVTGNTLPTTIYVCATNWFQTSVPLNEKVFPNDGKIVFLGDSWTQFPLVGGIAQQAITVRWKALLVRAGIDPSLVVNVGRGGMTTAWAKYHFKTLVLDQNPKYCYIAFYINDANSSSYVGDPSNTSWNFSSVDPYSPGVDVDGKVSQLDWINNKQWLLDSCIAHGITPIFALNSSTGSQTQTQGQSQWLSANKRPAQYYDENTLFSSSGNFDASVRTPGVTATTVDADTAAVRNIKAGVAGTNTGLTVLLQPINSAINEAITLKASVNYSGTAMRYLAVKNFDNTDRWYLTADGVSHAYGFDAFPSSNYGYKINNAFQISYQGGVARLTAVNSTSVSVLRVGDSIPKIQLYSPLTLNKYTTATLPSGGDKGAVVYDTDRERIVSSDGFNITVYAREDSVKARWDTVRTKINLIRNNVSWTAGQVADLWTIGKVRHDLGSDATYDMFYRGADGTMTRLPPGSLGQQITFGASGPQWTTPTTIVQTSTILKDFYSDQGNTSTTANVYNPLYTYDLAANRLNAPGEKIIAEFSGKYAANTNGKGLQVFVNNMGCGTITTSDNNSYFYVRVVVIRTGSNSARVVVFPATASTSAPIQTDLTGLTFSGTIPVALWGTSAAGAVNDVIAKLGTIKWEAAAP